MSHVDAILKVLPGTRRQIVARSGLSESVVRNNLRLYMRGNYGPKLVYICGWDREHCESKPSAVYAEGNQEDVPRDPFDAKAYRAAYNANRRNELNPEAERERRRLALKAEAIVKNALTKPQTPFSALFDMLGQK